VLKGVEGMKYCIGGFKKERWKRSTEGGDYGQKRKHPLQPPRKKEAAQLGKGITYGLKVISGKKQNYKPG